MRRKNKEWKRYFIAYLCVLLPLLLISLLVFRHTSLAAQQEQTGKIQVKLTALAEELDQIFLRYQRLASQLTLEKDLKKEKMASDGMDAIQGIHLLSLLSNSIPNNFSIAIFYPEMDAVYSSAGKTNAAIYWQNELRVTPASAARARAAGGKSAVLPLELSDGGVLILYQFDSSYYRSGPVRIHFSARMAGWEEKIRALAGGDPMTVQMRFGEDMDVFWYCGETGRARLVSAGECEALVPRAQAVSLSAPAAQTRIHLTALCPASVFNRRVAQMGALYLLLIILATLAAVALCYYLAIKRYRYVEKISRMVADGETAAPPSERYISDMVSKLVREKSENRRQADRMKTLIRQQEAELLFHGLLKDEQRIAALLESGGMSQEKGAYFSVMGVILPREEENLDAFLLSVGQEISCEVSIGRDRALMLLIPLPNLDTDRGFRRRLGEEVMDRSACGLSGIGFSSPFSRAALAGEALVETCCVLEYARNPSAVRQISCGEDIQHMRRKLKPLSPAQMERFRQALRKKDEEETRRQLQPLIRAIGNQENTDLSTRFLRYELVYAVTQEICKTEQKNDALLSDAMEIDTDDADWEKTLLRVIHRFCTSALKPGDFSQILNYVETNFTRYSLTLSEIAAHFQMNRSYLSTLFKERTGSTYMEYITRLRMERARELLTTTDLSVQEILEQVGYNDENNFRKRFREFYGQNPSDMRG